MIFVCMTPNSLYFHIENDHVPLARTIMWSELHLASASPNSKRDFGLTPRASVRLHTDSTYADNNHSV
jgi:hypothetical protein